MMLRLATTAMFIFAFSSSTVQAANFTVTCTAGNTTLAFNSYDVLAGTAVTLPLGSITVSCTSTHSSPVTVNYTLSLATSPARLLTSGGNTLSYDIYTDSNYSVQWGTTGTCTAGSNNNAGNVICGSFQVPAKSSASQSKTYYGKIPGGPAVDVPVGSYTQVGLAVTLTYSCNPAPTGGGTC